MYVAHYRTPYGGYKKINISTPGQSFEDIRKKLLSMFGDNLYKIVWFPDRGVEKFDPQEKNS